MRLAYSFEDSGKPSHVHRGVHDEAGQQELQEVVTDWHDLWSAARPALEVRDDGTRLHVFDTRPCARRQSWTAEELETEVYRLCDSAPTQAALLTQLSQRSTKEISIRDAERAIATLCDSKVLLPLNGRLLSIGVSDTKTSLSRSNG